MYFPDVRSRQRVLLGEPEAETTEENDIAWVRLLLKYPQQVIRNPLLVIRVVVAQTAPSL